MLGAAIARGVKLEICYAQALLSNDSNAKKMMIGNIMDLIRVTRGRGLIFSSEAKSALGVRAPSDVMNLASVWGLGHERGKDGLTKEARAVVEFARLKRTSYRGIVDIVYGGEKPPQELKRQKTPKNQQNKRKADSLENTPAQSGEEMPKQQMKRDKVSIRNQAKASSIEGTASQSPDEEYRPKKQKHNK
jgi:ribonuclease P/MRP protein subunit RPP1